MKVNEGYSPGQEEVEMTNEYTKQRSFYIGLLNGMLITIIIFILLVVAFYPEVVVNGSNDKPTPRKADGQLIIKNDRWWFWNTEQLEYGISPKVWLSQQGHVLCDQSGVKLPMVTMQTEE